MNYDPKWLHEGLCTPSESNYPMWTIYSDVKFGFNVRLGSYVIIERNCEFGDDIIVGNSTVFRPNTVLGSDIKIGHLCVFEGQTTIGNHTIIQSQSHITLGAIIGSKVFIGPGFIGVNDRKICHLRPKLNWIPEPFRIKDGARIGSGVNVTPGVTIGANTLIGQGSVVTKDIPDYSIAIGVPARVVGTVPEDLWV